MTKRAGLSIGQQRAMEKIYTGKVTWEYLPTSPGLAKKRGDLGSEPRLHFSHGIYVNAVLGLETRGLVELRDDGKVLATAPPKE